MSTVVESPSPVKINLREIVRLRAVPLFDGDREIGVRREIETADGVVHHPGRHEFFSLKRSLMAAGARMRHLNLGLDMYCRGTEVAVSWPAPATIDEEEKEPRPSAVEEAIEQMVLKGKTARPALAGRLDSAAALVLTGKVVLDDDAAKVSVYRVTADSCTCGDFRHRGGWCKHRLALRMARHLAANGFELPADATIVDRRSSSEVTPQVSAANLALIASGRVIDAERRSRAAFYNSGEGARQRIISAAANGAKSFPAGEWAKANGTTNQEVENGQ